MVAASAETLALQAYARDLGLDLDCELYCDSAAALGIAQRAGFGKSVTSALRACGFKRCGFQVGLLIRKC